MKDRYFIVWFSGYDDDDEIRNGSIQVIGNGGNYLNEEEIKDGVTKDFNLTGVFIKNFIEVPNKEDFKTFIHKEVKKDDDKGKFRFL